MPLGLDASSLSYVNWNWPEFQKCCFCVLMLNGKCCQDDKLEIINEMFWGGHNVWFAAMVG